MSQATMLPGILPPLRPWEYLRLRRIAAGLSIPQAAKLWYKRPEHAADIEAKVAVSEQPGAVIRNDHVVDELGRLRGVEPEVYRQLRDDPPNRHPDVCRGCGCTSWAPCALPYGLDCTGHETGTCTACEARAAKTRRAA